MVITELDYMKNPNTNPKLLKNVTNAIKFVNVALQDNNPRVVGKCPIKLLLSCKSYLNLDKTFKCFIVKHDFILIIILLIL